MKQFNILVVVISLLVSGCNNLTEKKKFEKKEIIFKFEANNKTLADRNFTTTREFVDDSIFLDKRILCNDTSRLCDIKFSFNNNVWRVWTGNNWASLFNEKSQLNRIDLQYTKKTIKPIEPYILGSDTLYAFTCKDESFDFSTDYTEYLLSKKDGIVIIKNEMTFYKRSDYKNNNLDSLKLKHYK